MNVLRSLILLPILSVLLINFCWAERTWESQVSRNFGSGSNTMRYSYFLPAGYSPDNNYPLVTYLHGAGLKGRDGRHVMHSSVADVIARTEVDFPAVLLVPQLPTGNWEPLGNPQDATRILIFQFLEEFSIDPDRIYLTGVSAGGFGATEYIKLFNTFDERREPPYKFAGAAITAGAFLDELAGENLRGTPIWFSHGGADTQVSPNFSRQAYLSLSGEETIEFNDFAAGGPTAISGVARYTEYPGAPHNTSRQFYGSTDVYEWLFSQTLNPIPEPGTLTCAMLVCLCCLGSRHRIRHSDSP